MKCALIAQLVEQVTLNHKVDGSSPSGHTNSFANFAEEKLFNFLLDIFGTSELLIR